ncbi:MAG: histidine--tRNA ligase [Endomicrobiales bacterium]|jgi:histidyl-tRNA synthetase
MNFSAPRGTHDVWGEMTRKLQFLEQMSRSVFGRYNYSEIRTPVFEDAGLFTRSIGESTDIVEKEMYVFEDRKGRKLALRPEGTASVVRAYLEHNLSQELPVSKLYYMGSMFRYERPQAGRYREFFQIGAEYFGNAAPGADAEVIMLARDVLLSVGLTDVSIHINSLGCSECRPAFRDALKKYFCSQSDLCSDCQRRLERNPLRLLDCKIDGHKFQQVPQVTDHLCQHCATHFQSVKELLDAAHCTYVVNPRLVRGLDYYTRTVFEIRSAHVGSQDALAAGGRYDNLIHDVGGPTTPSVGFALGSERVLMACDNGKTLSDLPHTEGVFIAVTDQSMLTPAFSVATILRGMAQVIRRVEGPFADKTLKSQMKLADRMGAQKVLIFGNDEYARGMVLVRDMKTQTQTEREISQLIKGGDC